MVSMGVMICMPRVISMWLLPLAGGGAVGVIVKVSASAAADFWPRRGWGGVRSRSSDWSEGMRWSVCPSCA